MQGKIKQFETPGKIKPYKKLVAKSNLKFQEKQSHTSSLRAKYEAQIAG